MGESLKSSRPQTEAMLFARICSFFQKQELAQIDELSVELTDRKEVTGQLTDHTKNLLFFPYEPAQNRQGRPILAQFTLSQALRKLLEGSRLSDVLAHQHIISVSRSGYPN